MATVALVPHVSRANALDLAVETVTWLVSEGHGVRIPADDAGSVDQLADYSWPTEELGAGLDLVVSLGGDGTMLRAVDLLAGSEVPVLGVNIGHLGYLTEVEPAGLRKSLDRFFAGHYKVERRMTLQVEVDGDTQSTWTALNEAVLEKTVSGHTVRLAAAVNGEVFTTYAADGLIVSTPTGSTAYNLSARGPILSPRHRAIVLTPVSPHMLFDRSLVLSSEEWVQLEVLEGPPAELVVDGRGFGPLRVGQGITCRAGAYDALFVTFGGRDFHQILKAKFGLADR